MENQKKIPFVTALLVTRNEKDYIEKAIYSLINQTYPKDSYEIIVIDGGSTDGTIDVVKRIIREESIGDFVIKIIDNPKHILASGWNIGIQSARGEYVTRIDAHAEAAPDFIEKSVQTQLKVEAVCVGGKLDSIPLEGDDLLVSKVLSSPFGVGNSSFRVSDTAGYADTAVYGLYRKSVFDEVGYFDEQLVRNQDIDLHSRIRKAGYKFYFNPEIKSVYHTRSSIKKMIRQAYGNGKWNMVLVKKGASALSFRHLVPFFFVTYIILSIVGGFFWWPIWTICVGVLLLYLLIGFVAGAKKVDSFCERLKMPYLFMLLHLSYGIGYYAGICYRPH